MILARPLLHAPIFVFFFSLCTAKFQLLEAGVGVGKALAGFYRGAGLKRASLGGKQKEIPSPPTVFSPRLRVAVGGSRQKQEMGSVF